MRTLCSPMGNEDKSTTNEKSFNKVVVCTIFIGPSIVASTVSGTPVTTRFLLSYNTSTGTSRRTSTSSPPTVFFNFSSCTVTNKRMARNKAVNRRNHGLSSSLSIFFHAPFPLGCRFLSLSFSKPSFTQTGFKLFDAEIPM